MPLDRNARVTLTRLARFADELRRSGIPATLDITDIENDSKSVKTNKVNANIKIGGNQSIGCSDTFKYSKEREKDHELDRSSMISSSFFSTITGGICGLLSVESIIWSPVIPSITVGAGIGLIVPITGFLTYNAIKAGSLKVAFQNASDLLSKRPCFSEERTKILHKIAQTLVDQAGDEQVITLTPQEMTPALKEIIRYAQTQGVRVDIVLPDTGKALQMRSPTHTLGQIVEQIAQPTPSPALPKPDAEQEKWAGGLATSFNRLSGAIDPLSPELKEAAQTLLNTVRVVQALCAEVRIANHRIGKVAHELDNVSNQINAYAQLKRLSIDTPDDEEALTTVFSIKAQSIAERFVEDLKTVRGNFQDRQKLLENDYI